MNKQELVEFHKFRGTKEFEIICVRKTIDTAIFTENYFCSHDADVIVYHNGVSLEFADPNDDHYLGVKIIKLSYIELQHEIKKYIKELGYKFNETKIECDEFIRYCIKTTE